MELKWLMILSPLVLIFSVATTSCTTISGEKDKETVTTVPSRTAADVKVVKKEAQHHFQLAQQHLKAGELEKAETEIGKVLVLDPKQPVPHLVAGDVYFAQSDYKNALEQYQMAASLDRTKGLPHVKTGRTYVKMDRLDKALVSYQAAIRLEPDVPGIQREFAQLCRRMGLDAEARQADEKAERLLKSRKFPATVDSREGSSERRGPGAYEPDPATKKVVRLGDEFFKEDLLPLAIEEYRIAERRAPNSLIVNQKLGDAYNKKGMLSEAIIQYQRSVELQPDAPLGYLGLGIVHSKMFDIQKALAYFGKGLSLAPDFTPLRFELALAYYKIDRLNDAMAELEKIADPDDANPHPEKLLQKIRAEKEAEEGFVEIQNEHFVLKYNPQQAEAFITDTQRELQAAYQKLSAGLAFQSREKIIVKLYPSLREFHEAASTPEWFWGGVASAKDFKVLLATPRKENNIEKFPQVITHELTHVFTNLITYGKHPAWIHEGLAIYEADQWNSAREKTLRKAVLEGSLFGLHELDKPFTRLKKPEQISLAYAQAYAAVDYIMETYGRDKLIDVLNAFSRGEDFDEASPEIFGMDSNTFEENWRADLKRKYAG